MEWILTVQKIAQATGGVIRNCDKDEIIKSVSTDSRSITEGALFLRCPERILTGIVLLPTRWKAALFVVL